MRPPGIERILIDAQACADLCAEIDRYSVRESCGFLLGTASGPDILVRRTAPVRNAAALRGGFAIPDYEQRRVERLARKLLLKIVAVYHSHPSGDSNLSLTDLQYLGSSKLPWVIVARAQEAGDATTVFAAYGPSSRAPIPVEIVQKMEIDGQ
jgi:proteasome lid subunit RPN8/RPN11